MPSPWTSEPGVVSFLEPVGGLSHAHLQKLREDTLGQPYMVEHRNTRHLFFGLAGVQSTMNLEDPTRLVSAYTRKMMAFLLLHPNPRHIVMIGLGGGSLAKFCYKHLPKTRLTIVEHDAEVIALRNHFCIPGDDERFRVIHADGAHYMQRTTEEADVVLVDAFDEAGIAPSLATADFYTHAGLRMQGHGVFVMNFSGERTRYVQNLQKIRATFDDRVLLVPVATDGNLLVFASKKIALHQRLKRRDRRAHRLQERLALEFPRFLARLRGGHGFRVTAAGKLSQRDILEDQARAEIIPGE